jgi:hypothetical protein
MTDQIIAEQITAPMLIHDEVVNEIQHNEYSEFVFVHYIGETSYKL